jgi:hypothetical protein
MNDVHTKSSAWKQKVVHELIEYWVTFSYLAFFLVAFVWYRRLVLAEYQVQYTNYWFPLIEAAVLAKVILIGDFLRFGRALEQKPLILPTLYRTVMFSVWVWLFSLLEATVRGLLHGKGLAAGFEEIANKGRYEFLSWCVVIFVAFIPFFAFKELERVLGKDTLRGLFWRQGTLAAGSHVQNTRREHN